MNMAFTTRTADNPTFAAPRLDPSTVAFASCLLKQREQKKRAFSELEINDIEWFILLELYVASTSGKQLSLSDLYYVAGIPKSTAIRAINNLVKSGHLCRAFDPHDARRRLLWLELETLARLERLLTEMLAVSDSAG